MNLKKRTIIIAVLTFSVTFVISYLSYERIKNDIMTKIGSMYLRKQMQFNHERALNPLMRELALAQKMASSATLIKWAEHENDPELRKRAVADLESYRKLFSDESYFVAFLSSGNYYFKDSSAKYAKLEPRYKLNPENPEHRWFFATVKSGKPYLLNVDYDEQLNVTKVWINVVLKDGSRPIGVLGTGIELKDFIRKVIKSSQKGTSNILITENGAIQAYSDVSKIDFRSIAKSANDHKTLFQMLDKEDALKLADAIRKSKKDPDEIPILSVDFKGARHLIGVEAVKEFNWYTVTLLDIDTVIGKYQFLPFAVLILLSGIIFTVIIYMLLNKFIFTRILSLEKSVETFEREIKTTDNLVCGMDEIGNLEHAFFNMMKTVATNADELEGKVAKRTQDLKEKNDELVKALEEIKVLNGLLPICSYCKKIRNDSGYWEQLERYMELHTDAKFTHGICPECFEKHFPEISDNKSSDFPC